MKNQSIADGSVLVGRYKICKYIKAGGMQEVYLGHDQILDRKVAIKTPFTKSAVQRFKRSAKISAQVNHPNIASTIDYFQEDDNEFLVEEFIDGADLGERLERDFYFLDPHLAAHVIHHIARSLQAAHQAHICHRDLKPSNIMTSPDSGMQSIKLTDFGIAKMAEDELEKSIDAFGKDGTTITGSKTLLGAIPYMAPECWSDWKNADTPMDIWALGAIGYHLLAGTPPFGFGGQAIAAILSGRIDVTKPSWFGKHIQSEFLEDSLWALITSCLKTDPKERPKTSDLLRMCSKMCYSNQPRQDGIIQRFGADSGDFGFISHEDGNHFFHGTEFYSLNTSPQVGLRVNFSAFQGDPQPRVAPVLHIKNQ